jgi:hypothetical protein
MDSFNAISGQHTYRNILGDDSFSVTAEIRIETFLSESAVTKWISTRIVQESICAVPAAEGVGNDS